MLGIYSFLWPGCLCNQKVYEIGCVVPYTILPSIQSDFEGILSPPFLIPSPFFPLRPIPASILV